MKKRTFNNIVNKKITMERREKREKRLSDVRKLSPTQMIRVVAAMGVSRMRRIRKTRGIMILRCELAKNYFDVSRKKDPGEPRGYARAVSRTLARAEAAKLRAQNGSYTRSDADREVRIRTHA